MNETVRQLAPSKRSPARRRARGLHPRRRQTGQNPGRFRPAQIPEYLEVSEVDQLLQLAPHPDARLLMLIQWRAGLRISEALALERQDVRLDGDRATLRVRQGKGGRSRVVPVHAELAAALRTTLGYRRRDRRDARIVGVGRSAASEWIAETVRRAVAAGVIEAGRHVASHTFRHSYARHLLASGVPVNTLSRWMGHSQLASTLVYLALVPDPAGTMDAVP